jgi:hypothetical protein
VLVVLQAQLTDDVDLIDRAVLGLHLSLPVPHLPSRHVVRRFVERHIIGCEQAMIDRVRTHLAERWLQSIADWTQFREISRTAAKVRRDAPGRLACRMVQPSLFGRYAGPSPSRSANPAQDDLPSPSVPRERIELALIILRPGTAGTTLG